jgi:hypothetical protein
MSPLAPSLMAFTMNIVLMRAEVVGRLAGDRQPPRLRRMLELSMATSR